MPNTLYDFARRKLLSGEVVWASADNNNTPGPNPIRVCLVRTGAGNYTFSAAHDNMSQIAGFIGNTSAGSATAIATLTNPLTTAQGAADGDDVTFSQVTSGQTINAIVIYLEISSVNQALNLPVAFIDTATGLPITANGGDIIVTWDNGPNRIFRP
jgi:hypothetical protein